MFTAATKRKNIEAAMAVFEENTCIRFANRTTETSYIYFSGIGECSSFVGRTGRGQKVSLTLPITHSSNVGKAMIILRCNRKYVSIHGIGIIKQNFVTLGVAANKHHSTKLLPSHNHVKNL